MQRSQSSVEASSPPLFLTSSSIVTESAQMIIDLRTQLFTHYVQRRHPCRHRHACTTKHMNSPLEHVEVKGKTCNHSLHHCHHYTLRLPCSVLRIEDMFTILLPAPDFNQFLITTYFQNTRRTVPPPPPWSELGDSLAFPRLLAPNSLLCLFAAGVLTPPFTLAELRRSGPSLPPSKGVWERTAGKYEGGLKN